jgi:hypothetical protein
MSENKPKIALYSASWCNRPPLKVCEEHRLEVMSIARKNKWEIELKPILNIDCVLCHLCEKRKEGK